MKITMTLTNIVEDTCVYNSDTLEGDKVLPIMFLNRKAFSESPEFITVNITEGQE